MDPAFINPVAGAWIEGDTPIKVLIKLYKQ
jgi:hypothetical protein